MLTTVRSFFNGHFSLALLQEAKAMIEVSIPEALAKLSKLIQLLETKKEEFVIVTRNGKPVVKITLIA